MSSDSGLPAADLAILPRMVTLRRRFPQPRLEDVAAAVTQGLERLNLGDRVAPGGRVAITAGSRGITNIVTILASAVTFLKALGVEPFIVGAMGSHGGGTAQGQREVLQSLGITPDTVGAPVLTSDEVVALGETAGGHTVYCDKSAAEADGILVVNRVKPHTAFRAPNESGLMKMLTVGLGKHPGASSVHRLGPREIGEAIREMARLVLSAGKVVGGLAIMENSKEETAKIQGLRPEEIEAGEQALLVEAKALLPKLPVEDIDVLIVDEMGKNYSGTGMDTNVIGRWRIQGVPEPDSPRVSRLVVLDLSESSHGNATGIGLADFTTRRLVSKADWHSP
ncbi:MAG: nickel-dependent lactate racemase, partial [Actinobacteria bacterium]|nr:nickel-dependent lactate racemase [Actinomycetota bacterium]